MARGDAGAAEPGDGRGLARASTCELGLAFAGGHARAAVSDHAGRTGPASEADCTLVRLEQARRWLRSA
jgi:hypothetical protein